MALPVAARALILTMFCLLVPGRGRGSVKRLILAEKVGKPEVAETRSRLRAKTGSLTLGSKFLPVEKVYSTQ